MAEIGVRRAPDTFAMPALTIKEMEQHGVSSELIERLFGSRSQVNALTKKNKPLSPEHTDKAIRVLRIVALAEKVFESSKEALIWLNSYNETLEAKPSDLLIREAGATMVENALLQVEYSVYA